MIDQLAHLERDYSLSGDTSVITSVLTEVPALYSLLGEAVEPLERAFGSKKLLQLQTLESDDDTVLRVMVRLPLTTAGVKEKMSRFKHDWWLKNCSRSEALLVFDYELGNGF